MRLKFTLSKAMCWMLDIITYKEFSKQENRRYLKEYGIGIYDKTTSMVNAETNKHYYVLSCGCCAREFRQIKSIESYVLLDILEDCVKYGELILFFYHDDGYYRYIEDNVHMYIDYAKKIEIQFDVFRDTFITKGFIYDDVVCIIKK